MIQFLYKTSKKLYVLASPFQKKYIISKDAFKISKSYFSTAKNHPTIQKIIDGQNTTNLDSLLLQIGGLNDKNREIALKLILKDIYTHKLNISTISNPNFVNQAMKNPPIYLDSLLFKVKELIRKLNDVLIKKDMNSVKDIVSEINDLFVLCFDIFKKIPSEQGLKHQVLLNKRFADYNLMYLGQMVDRNQKRAILLKCYEFYKRTTHLMDKLIRQECQKLKKARDDTSNQTQKQQEKDLKINSLKQNCRMLVETNSENTIHLFRVINELHNRKKDQIEFDEGVVEMLSNFQRAIAWYSFLGRMSTHSIFYHRIKKIKMQLNHYYKRSNLGKKERNDIEEKALQAQFTNQQKQLYDQTSNDLLKISNQEKYLGNMQQLSLVMLSIKVYQLKKLKLDQQTFQNKFFQQIKCILDIIVQPKIRKIVASKIGKVAKQILESDKNKRINQNQQHNKNQ